MIATDLQISEVALAVEEGFSQMPKRLPSWLFYDGRGDKIFQRIMKMPEYYLTHCEFEILEANKEKLVGYFNEINTPFNLVELGAGDGYKTSVLLSFLRDKNIAVQYTPVDVSESVLLQLQSQLKRDLPGIQVNPIYAKYEEAMEVLSSSTLRKVFLFMGANIGNFSISSATKFIGSLADKMQDGDQLLVGFDLKKDPRLIQSAYDDPHGITREFNLNLLVRLNRELGANFNIQQFDHFPYYNPETGTTKSYLVSKVDQDVYFEACDKLVHFSQWESIHTEVSQKYDLQMIESLADSAGLEIMESFYDSKRFFADVLFVKNNSH